jgi:hypothetical protein
MTIAEMHWRRRDGHANFADDLPQSGRAAEHHNEPS